MTSNAWRLRAIALALIVGLAPLTLAVVPSLATTGNDHFADEPPTEPYDGSGTPGTPGTHYAVTQGGTCTVVEPLGDGSTAVEDEYRYRTGPNTSYSAYGFADLQENQGSLLFLYEGASGTSLVMLHDRIYGPEGGVATFTFDGLPTGDAAEWVVKDDFYGGPTNWDRFDVGGASATIDWTWRDYRTDGAAFVGMQDGDYDAVTLTPEFNQDAHFWGASLGGGTTDELTSWTLRSGDGATRALEMDAPVQIRRGTCVSSENGDSGPVRTAFVTDEDDDSVTTRFYNPPTDDGFTATFDVGTDDVRLHALHVVPSQPVDRVDATVRRLDGNPTNTSVPTDGSPTFVRLDGVGDAIDDRTLTFSVSRDALDASGSDPDDVTVFNRTDDGWEPIETTIVGSNDERVWATAPVPAGEPIAIATAPPVTVDVDRGTYGSLLGETVDVTATLTNDGTVSWNETVTFTVDGATANETTVSIDGGEQVTITRSYTFDDGGVHTVGVNGETRKLLVLDPSLFDDSGDSDDGDDGDDGEADGG